MKSVLETSLYLFLMSFICFISIKFIAMNEDVTKVNELASYTENYIEAMGSCKTEFNTTTNKKEIIYYKYDNNQNLVKATQTEINNPNIKTFPILENNLDKTLEDVAKSYGFDIKFEYIDATDNYIYIEYTINYTLANPLLGYVKSHNYVGLARFSYIY